MISQSTTRGGQEIQLENGQVHALRRAWAGSPERGHRSQVKNDSQPSWAAGAQNEEKQHRALHAALEMSELEVLPPTLFLAGCFHRKGSCDENQPRNRSSHQQGDQSPHDWMWAASKERVSMQPRSMQIYANAYETVGHMMSHEVYKCHVNPTCCHIQYL